MDIGAREVSILLGVVVERRQSSHPWANQIWVPVSVFSNADPIDSWRVMLDTPEISRYHAATMNLTLHRKETEAYVENLSLPEPELYVILQETEDLNSEFPYQVLTITVSPFEAQDYQDAGDEIIEKVPMPEEVAAFVETFVDCHHVEQKFIKRKRDKVKLEDQKFGKHPIFVNPTRH